MSPVRALAGLGGLLGLALACACSPKPRAAQIDPDTWRSAIPTADMTRAAALYTHTRNLPGETEPVSCAVCHGAQGQGNYGKEDSRHIAPHLAGLNAVYVGEQLRAYANGTRVFPLMHAMAADLSAQDVADLSIYVHGLRGGGAGSAPVTDPDVLARGYAVYSRGLPGHAASCAECHGSDGAGKSGRSPEIAGEPLPYLIAQLQLMKTKGRKGTLAADAMTEEAHKLTPNDIHAVAAYVASLEPVSARGSPIPSAPSGKGPTP